MTKNKPSDIEIKTFATHRVIMQPNPLRSALRRVPEGKDADDDPVARAEQALAMLRRRSPRRLYGQRLRGAVPRRP